MSSILTSRLRGEIFADFATHHPACRPQVFLVNTTRCVRERWAVKWRLERFCQILRMANWSKMIKTRWSQTFRSTWIHFLTKPRVFTAPRQNRNWMPLQGFSWPDRNPRKSLEIIWRGLDTQRRGIAALRMTQFVLLDFDGFRMILVSWVRPSSAGTFGRSSRSTGTIFFAPQLAIGWEGWDGMNDVMVNHH